MGNFILFLQMKLSTLALLAPMAVDARIKFFSKCPEAPRARNFDKTRFAGEWYEIMRDSEFYWESGQTCSTSEFRLQDDGSLSLYYRANSSTWGGYSGIGGRLWDCGESANHTCLAQMSKGP